MASFSSTTSLRRPSKLMSASLAARDASFRRTMSQREKTPEQEQEQEKKQQQQQHHHHHHHHHPHSALLSSLVPAASLRQGSWRTQELQKMKQREVLENAFANEREEAESKIRLRHELTERKREKDQNKLGVVAEKGLEKGLKRAMEREMARLDNVFSRDVPVSELHSHLNRVLGKMGRALVQKYPMESEDPLHLICPITLDLFEDPVISPSGHSYSRAAITKYVAQYERCPMTRATLRVDQLYPNRSIADAVLQYQLRLDSCSDLTFCR